MVNWWSRPSHRGDKLQDVLVDIFQTHLTSFDCESHLSAVGSLMPAQLCGWSAPFEAACRELGLVGIPGVGNFLTWSQLHGVGRRNAGVTLVATPRLCRGHPSKEGRLPTHCQPAVGPGPGGVGEAGILPIPLSVLRSSP